MKIYRTETNKEWLTSERCHIIEIMNDSFNKDISLARARVEPGIKTQLHSLKTTDEIYYILQGTGTMIVDTTRSAITKGDCVRIRAGQSQLIVNDGQEDLIFLCICRPSFSPSNYVNLEV